MRKLQFALPAALLLCLSISLAQAAQRNKANKKTTPPRAQQSSGRFFLPYVPPPTNSPPKRDPTDNIPSPSRPALAANIPAPRPILVQPTPVGTAISSRSFIDKFIDEKLDASAIPASEQIDDAEFIRRVSIDITGRIPTAARVTGFLADTRPDKRARVIDELLASPDFGRHFADEWKLVLAPPDAMVRGNNIEALAAWLAEQFNAGRPFDQITRSLLLAEGSPRQNPQAYFYIANGDAKGFPQADILTRTVSQAFMGIQLQCAQCHDHPLDDHWKQQDFWGMATFFSRVKAEKAEKNAVDGVISESRGNAKNKKQDALIKTGAGASVIVPPESFTNVGKTYGAKFPDGASPSLDNVTALRPTFAAWLTDKSNKFLAPTIANRTWALLMGRGLVDPVDDFCADNKPTHPELLAALAGHFVDSNFDLKDLVRTICLSRAYQRSAMPLAANQSDETLYSHAMVKVLSPEQLAASLDVALDGKSSVNAAAIPRNPSKLPAGTPVGHIKRYFQRGEGAAADEYTYGVPQALLLMNQVQFNNGASLVERLLQQGLPRDRIIDQLYFATLSRPVASAERSKANEFIAKQKTARDGYNGLLWSLINRSEFVLNH